MDKAQIDAMHRRRISAMGREEGIDYQFDKARTSNTFDAHRLVHLAAEQGRRTEMDRPEANFHDGIRGAIVRTPIRLADELGVSGAAGGAREPDVLADAVRRRGEVKSARASAACRSSLLDGRGRSPARSRSDVSSRVT